MTAPKDRWCEPLHPDHLLLGQLTSVERELLSRFDLHRELIGPYAIAEFPALKSAQETLAQIITSTK